MLSMTARYENAKSIAPTEFEAHEDIHRGQDCPVLQGEDLAEKYELFIGCGKCKEFISRRLTDAKVIENCLGLTPPT